IQFKSGLPILWLQAFKQTRRRPAGVSDEDVHIAKTPHCIVHETSDFLAARHIALFVMNFGAGFAADEFGSEPDLIAPAGANRHPCPFLSQFESNGATESLAGSRHDSNLVFQA